MLDLNRGEAPEDWLELLRAAEENAETAFEIAFCESLRRTFETHGEDARLSEAQKRKLRCIALAGGFWERGA